jgi:hypothetical protein
MQKRPTNMSLWLNGVQGNIEIELGVDTNMTAVLTNATYAMYMNITTNITAAQGWVNQTRLSVNSNISNTTETAGFSVGRYNITAHFDGDENHTAGSVTYYLNITDDVTPPTVRIYDNVLAEYGLNNDTARALGLNMSVNVSVSDTGVGMTGKSCIATIGGSSAGSQAYSGGWCNMTLTVPSGLSDGARLLNITINDTNLNTGVNGTYYITVDNTAPVLTITFPAANGTYNKSDSGKYIWINGTVSDNLQMGTGNVSINGTYFNDTATTARPFNFTGGNNTAFSYRNTSAIPDGLYAFTINYTDNATNIGNTTVYFYVDNTPPSAAYGLTNSSNGTYQSSATQNVQVRVNDVRQTNETTILNYTKWDTDALRWAWTTATMTGTPNTSTVYTGTIDTRCGQYNASGYTLQYYIIGVDNATNTITSTVAGSSSSPLSTITINEYCGNSGNTLGYCSDQALLLSGNFRSITWTKEQLTNCTSLNSDYNISTVLSSINGKYNFVYYKNITASGVSWVAYDPSLAWGLNTLRFANNTNDDYYIYVNASAAVLRIV